MKIAIDCRMIGSGGIGTYISELIPYFLKSHECLLLGRMGDIEQYGSNPNATLCECNIKTFSLKELLFFPHEICKKINQCDVYYTPYCNIPSGIHIPIFCTIHDIVFLDVPHLTSAIGTLGRRWFYKHAIHKSTHIFTVSNFSKERIINKLGCRKPITVTFSAVPTWLLPSSDEQFTKTDTILFVGNIKRHKGLHTLLPAFLEARKKGLSAKLVIVGNAQKFRSSDDSIAKEIDDMPQDSVVFTGKISDSMLKRLYAESKLLVQPSLYEGFGLPPLEALTLGTNALITDIPVFKEVYKEFPVVYFRTGDSHDLSEKILTSINLKAPVKIPNLYSFEKTYVCINDALALNK